MQLYYEHLLNIYNLHHFLFTFITNGVTTRSHSLELAHWLKIVYIGAALTCPLNPC